MGYIPEPYNEFDPWQKQLVTGLLIDPISGLPAAFPPAPGADPAKWKIWEIPEANMAALLAAQAVYQPFYDKWSDEDKRNDEIIEDHEREHDIYEAIIRVYVGENLRKNQKLDTGDLAGLGLTVPDTEPTAVTAVEYGPVLSVDKMSPLFHKIRVADPEHPDTQAMPKGHKLELQRFIGAANLPGTELQLATYKVVGRFLITSEFTEEDKGKTAYYRAFYLTTRGDRSPASEILSALIP